MLVIQYIKNVYKTFSDCGYHHPRVKTGTTLFKKGIKKIVVKKVMNSLRSIPPLPPDTVPFVNQVAGHKYSDGKIGCLQHTDGTILKPVQCPPKGQREVDFYLAVFSETCTDKSILQLHQFVPKFYGIVQAVENSDVRYLKLENLLLNMSKPCILDIKMGQITYDPEAPPEKRALELAKFPPAMKLGYQLSGMQAYSPENEKMIKYDKYYCKKLNEETMVQQGFGKFFSTDSSLRKDVIAIVIERLKVILDWFQKQRKYAFYASSILIAFDGDTLEKMDKLLHEESGDYKPETDMCNGDKESILDDDYSERSSQSSEFSEQSLPHVEVRMIDFTHVFCTTEEDNNYIFGLQNLIDHLQVLLDAPL